MHVGLGRGRGARLSGRHRARRGDPLAGVGLARRRRRGRDLSHARAWRARIVAPACRLCDRRRRAVDRLGRLQCLSIRRRPRRAPCAPAGHAPAPGDDSRRPEARSEEPGAVLRRHGQAADRHHHGRSRQIARCGGARRTRRSDLHRRSRDRRTRHGRGARRDIRSLPGFCRRQARFCGQEADFLLPQRQSKLGNLRGIARHGNRLPLRHRWHREMDRRGPSAQRSRQTKPGRPSRHSGLSQPRRPARHARGAAPGQGPGRGVRGHQVSGRIRRRASAGRDQSDDSHDADGGASRQARRAAAPSHRASLL